MHSISRSLSIACFAIAALNTLAGDSNWPEIARTPHRSADAVSFAPSLQRQSWVATAEHDELFVSHATPVAADGRVFVIARVFDDRDMHVANRVISIDARTGGRIWSRDVSPDVLESWSSPAISESASQVFVASGQTLSGFDAADGRLAWSIALNLPVANSSPAIADDLNTGGVSTHRLFITDFSADGDAFLYAINLSPREESANPFEPGEIVWSQPVGPLSGATPAYADGVVVVATIAGDIVAYAADAPGPGNEPLWRTPAASDGFFGGVAIRDGACFAVSYDFYGGQNNSRLVKLSLSNGSPIWSIACERTSSIPLVAKDDSIYVSGGVRGFGSRVKLQKFVDHGDSATLVWDTHVATSGALDIGGWTHQPVLSGDFMLVGQPPKGNFLAPYLSLLIVRPANDPGANEFVVDRRDGAGGSASVWRGRIFSMGETGLHAIVSDLTGDMNCDGRINFDDIDGFVLAIVDATEYLRAEPDCDPDHADMNDDGRRDFDDIELLVEALVQ